MAEVNGTTYKIYEFVAEETFAATPVLTVATMQDVGSMTLLVWGTPDALYYGMQYNTPEFIVDRIPVSGSGARNPSLSAERVGSGGNKPLKTKDESLKEEFDEGFYFHLVWEEAEQIFYTRGKLTSPNYAIDWGTVFSPTIEYKELSLSGNPVVVSFPEVVERVGESAPHVFWHSRVSGDFCKSSFECGNSIFYWTIDTREPSIVTLTQLSHQTEGRFHSEYFPTASIQSSNNTIRCVWQCDDHLATSRRVLPEGKWEDIQYFNEPQNSGDERKFPNIISFEDITLSAWTVVGTNFTIPHVETKLISENEKSSSINNENNFRRGSVNLSKVKLPGGKEHRLNGALWVESNSYQHNIGGNQIAIPFSIERHPNKLQEWLGTESFTVSANDILTGENVFTLSDFSVNEIDSVRTTPFLLVELIDAQTKQTLLELDKLTLQQIASWNVSDSVIVRPIAQSLSGLEGKEVNVRVRLVGQRELLREPAWTEIIYSEDSASHSATKQGVLSKENGEKEIPSEFTLEQNYPNPFNPVTVIRYQLPVNSVVQLKIYDVLGKEVTTLVNGYEEAGYKSVEFDAGKLSSGIYFYKLIAGSYVATKKLAVMK
ncbi:MAG: T9SS type A sorting domain-containing protein [Ignavibacteriales bacterium]|nr:T9SS type A sorting domain-containing protein [Ignavibacteriales bacterium]